MPLRPIVRFTAPRTCASLGSAAADVFRRCVDRVVPRRTQCLDALREIRAGARFAEEGVEFFERARSIALDCNGVALRDIVATHIDRHEAPLWVLKQRVRSGREVLQARAYCENQVRVCRELVRCSGAGHADRTDVERMVPGQGALAGLRLGDRNAVACRELRKHFARLGVMNAAACDEDRLLRACDQLCGRCELASVRSRSRWQMNALIEECSRIVPSFRLHILRERERDGSAFGGIGEHAERLRQTAQQLFRARDPVPIAGHRTKTVVGRDRGVVEIFDLLQHRIGSAAREHIAGQQQHGQPIDVRQRRRGHHVGRARADRSGARHELTPLHRFGIGDCRVRHRLFVVRTMRRQYVAHAGQRFAEPRDVTVAEDREHARNQRHGRTVEHGLLGDEVSHQRLAHREAYRLCGHDQLRASRQLTIRRR